MPKLACQHDRATEVVVESDTTGMYKTLKFVNFAREVADVHSRLHNGLLGNASISLATVSWDLDSCSRARLLDIQELVPMR